jgi:hypothetical protein
MRKKSCNEEDEIIHYLRGIVASALCVVSVR